MSTSDNQTLSYLLQHGVSLPMISILQGQYINDDDLQTMDRDDIEHLFKNEYGFTFGDRKRFWNAIKKFQSVNKKNDIIYVETQTHNETPDLYEIIDDEPTDYQLTQHYRPLSVSPLPSSPKRLSSTTVYDHFDDEIETSTVEDSSSENNDDNLRRATTSLPVYDQFAKQLRRRTNENFIFEYPVELPLFSSNVQKALEANNIQEEWSTLIKELAQWIGVKAKNPPKKCEYQAIGQTLFKLYPCTGRDGFRPCVYQFREKQMQHTSVSRYTGMQDGCQYNL
ncbi:unnamed protein product [Adineta steineri]|uniref:Uncharacterized protein n=1 Tax=Adineta steineri TaxID=433720 RepID=A0A814ZET5_9BILA|nr:unnamed protein product [Adineta steineri]